MSKFLIVGLGNVGLEYAKTRHNVGFMAVDKWVHQQQGAWSQDRYAYTSQFTFRGKAIIVIKPVTFMNLSGRAVAAYVNLHKILASQCLIVADDLALPFGTIRIRPKGNHAGHNGLRSIQEHLQTDAFPRLRIGIGDNFPQGKQTDFVLGDFSDAEQLDLQTIILPACGTAIEDFVFRGIQEAMNRANKNLLPK